jgi:hypothetical protein
MLICSIQKTTSRSEPGLLLLGLACALFFLVIPSSAQIYVPAPPPSNPADYGKVILNTYSARCRRCPGCCRVFDHWQHRAKLHLPPLSCRYRLCHGGQSHRNPAQPPIARASIAAPATMARGPSRARPSSPPARMTDNDPTLRPLPFRSAVPNARKERLQGPLPRNFPKAIYGVNWEAAEKEGLHQTRSIS